MKIIKINDNILKQKITDEILRSLPKWFGVEKSIIEYVDSMDDKDFFAAIKDGDYIGFFAVDYLNSDIANLYVLGIKKEYHNQGIGTKIYNEIENHLKSLKYKYVSVYTLSAKSTYEYYARTRNFYHKIGFIEAYENTKIWDEENPFLLMIKYIG